jgi:hypothetical protein
MFKCIQTYIHVHKHLHIHTGQNVVQSRNAKKQALEEFAKENNLKPESVKKAYKRFQASDRYNTYIYMYIYICIYVYVYVYIYRVQINGFWSYIQ